MQNEEDLDIKASETSTIFKKYYNIVKKERKELLDCNIEELGFVRKWEARFNSLESGLLKLQLIWKTFDLSDIKDFKTFSKK